MLTQIISTAFFVIGFFVCMKEGFILQYWGAFVRELSETNQVTKYLCKPLGTCVVCMSSVYGMPFLYYNFAILNITIIVATAGLIYFLSSLLNILKYGDSEDHNHYDN